MNSNQIAIFRLLIIFAMILTVSACTSVKHGLYELGLKYEYMQAGLDVKTVDMDGKLISFLESERDPAKPTVVLIHGLTANKENWMRFSRYLTDTYHVVAIDLPGHGASTKDLSMSYDIDDQVAYLNKILCKLEIRQFHMAGNSMGGAISCLYATTYPGQVQSLFLIDPSGIYDDKFDPDQLLDEGGNPFIITCSDDFDRLLNLVMEDKSNLPPWPIVSVMAEKAIENKFINEKLCLDVFKEHNYVFREELKKIHVPTLILWGKKDRILPVNTAILFEELIPRSKKTVLEGIGHMAMLEAPKKSAQVYLDFLSSF